MRKWKNSGGTLGIKLVPRRWEKRGETEWRRLETRELKGEKVTFLTSSRDLFSIESSTKSS